MPFAKACLLSAGLSVSLRSDAIDLWYAVPKIRLMLLD